MKSMFFGCFDNIVANTHKKNRAPHNRDAHIREENDIQMKCLLMQIKCLLD